jgi:hypothetical protein
MKRNTTAARNPSRLGLRPDPVRPDPTRSDPVRTESTPRSPASVVSILRPGRDRVPTYEDARMLPENAL